MKLDIRGQDLKNNLTEPVILRRKCNLCTTILNERDGINNSGNTAINVCVLACSFLKIPFSPNTVASEKLELGSTLYSYF